MSSPISAIRNLTLLILFSCSLCQGSVKENLAKVPAEDQEKLERFFKWLICKDCMGFTLWGNKPMTTTHWSVGFCPTQLFRANQRNHLEALTEIWNKYAHLFPMKKFVFGDHVFFGEEECFHELYLINKVKCEELYKRYSNIFSDALPLDKILKERKTIDHKKMGLLFGYGLHNTEIFLRIDELQAQLAHLPLPPQKPAQSLERIPEEELSFLRLNRRPLEGFGYINQEDVVRDYINMKERCISFVIYSKENPLNPISLPVFMVDKENDETKKLYSEYSETRKQIYEILKKPNFLELVLEKLSEE